ncbi:triose-phosphate isomerase [Patescibacteria group bacterium]|nr:triose-phosphate isomerase [Patescibacteria group bacterium]
MNNNLLVVGNWKMKLGLKESLKLANGLKKKIKRKSKVEVGICPSHSSLYPVAAAVRGSNIKLGAQNLFWEEEGAFTGEISPSMLKELGCELVIIGHSERRQYLGETDEMVHKKTRIALENKIMPIVCVGENLEEREDKKTDFIIINQVTKALQGINVEENDQLVVAYEPVWVIGSGQAINPEDAEHVHRVIRQTLIDLNPKEVVDNNFRIIYGGSVDSDNVTSFTDKKLIEGVLVGGASLKAEKFVNIINAIK